MGKRILVVGGVAGGGSCAARLRRLDETAEIVMFERGEYISFANCGLPYYIGGVIPKREALLVQDVPTMNGWFNIDVHVKTEVFSINKEEKTITVCDLTTGIERKEAYDVLVLSPGAMPIVPPLAGIEEAKDRLFTLRNIADVDAIKNFIDTQKPQTATVIGGGFIGLEMVENLRHLGLNVHLVEAMNQVLPPLDPEMATLAAAELRKNEVQLHLGNALASFEDEGRRVVLANSKSISTDFTILAIGVRPENKLVREAGVEVGERGGILVDDQFHVLGLDDVYAIGDAIEVRDIITGERAQIPLAGPANRMGRMCADIICGKDKHYKGSLGSAIVRCFSLTCASTGKNEKTLTKLGQAYQSIHIYPANHATYYPGAAQMCLKVLYNPADGLILGAQAVGAGNGIDKTIDIIATAIGGKQTVYDLADLELCYAPPFNTAKAPVNFVGYVAENIATGEAYFDDTAHLDDLIDEGNFVLDVRGPKEVQRLPIPASLNIPLPVLRKNLDKLPKGETIYVSCMIGVRGHIACRILQNNGFDVVNVGGGAKLYLQSKM